MKAEYRTDWFDRPAIAASVIALLFLATLLIGWSGLAPNDSGKYIDAALRWREDGPTLGTTHWALRLPLIVPMAASFAAFGASELASALPNILFAGGLVAITLLFGRRHLGAAGAAAAAALVATSAFFVTKQSEVSISGVEAFFVALSIWIFADAVKGGAGPKRYALAGAVAGGAWLCREVAIFLPAAFALFLLLRRPLSWPAIFATGAGFAALIIIEMIAYGAVTGDPLYRYLIDFGHRGANPYVDIITPAKSPADYVVQPIFYLISAAETTLFLVLAGAVFLDKGFRARFADKTRRDIARLFGLCALLAYVGAAYGLNLKSNDYYPIVAYASFLSLGAYVGHLYETRGRTLGVAVFLALFSLNAAIIDFRRYDEYSESRHLARLMIDTGASVTTDHATAARTRTLLLLAGVSDDESRRRVVSHKGRPAQACGLIYRATPDGSAYDFAAEPQWREVMRDAVRRKPLTHRALAAIGLSASPSRRLNEILRGAGPVILYDAGACPD